MAGQGVVLDLLQRLGRERSLDPLKELFWAELNYGRVNKPLSRRGWKSEVARNALAEDPNLFAGHDGFSIIYSRLSENRLLLGHERPVISTLLRTHP